MVRWASTRARVVSPAPAISHRAASVPSALVPDIRPTISRAGRWRRASSAATGSLAGVDVSDDGTQRSSVLVDELGGPLGVHPGVVHDQGHLGAAAGFADQLGRLRLV